MVGAKKAAQKAAQKAARVLVVEDEKHLGVGIKYNLEAEGYTVTLVEDGPTALKLISGGARPFDAIVLDLMLPGMSGYTVCQTLRDGGVNIPILMLSARTLPEDRTRGFDVGANQYLTKPFDLDELLSRVNNLLQLSTNTEVRSQPIDEGPDQIAVGRLRADFRTHEVTVDGDPVRMSPKELRLLRYFATHPDRVIPRGELLTEVWETSPNVQTRAVDQFIARLRKSIEEKPSSPRHLLTVRDAGYRWVPEP